MHVILCYQICHRFIKHENTRSVKHLPGNTLVAPLAQLAEQVTLNSRESFCAGLHAFAKGYFTRAKTSDRMHFFCVPLRCFASKIHVTVENDREKRHGRLRNP